ncbi:MAG: hypothetical protein ACPIOQ_81555, partial [Promethearchaeia archaeon]
EAAAQRTSASSESSSGPEAAAQRTSASSERPHSKAEQAASQRHDGKLQRASNDPANAPTSDSERRATMTVRAST